MWSLSSLDGILISHPEAMLALPRLLRNTMHQALALSAQLKSRALAVGGREQVQARTHSSHVGVGASLGAALAKNGNVNLKESPGQPGQNDAKSDGALALALAEVFMLLLCVCVCVIIFVVVFRIKIHPSPYFLIFSSSLFHFTFLFSIKGLWGDGGDGRSVL